MAAFAAGDPLASPPHVNHLYPLEPVLDDLVTSILVLLSVTIYRPCVFQCEDEERALVATLRSTTVDYSADTLRFHFVRAPDSRCKPVIILCMRGKK